MPGILSFFSTNGLWQSQRSVDTWECQAWTRRVCNVPGWTKRQKKRDKANTNIRVCLWRRRGKQKSCPAWQQHSFWLVFIWAWPFDNRCDWGGPHSPHFLFVSKVIHLEHEGVGGGRGEGIKVESAHHGISRLWWMIEGQCAWTQGWCVHQYAFDYVHVCVYVCAWDCMCLRAFYLYTTFARVYVVCVGVYVTHAWTPLGTGVQLHHTPVMLSVILGFGRQWSLHKLKNSYPRLPLHRLSMMTPINFHNHPFTLLCYRPPISPRLSNAAFSSPSLISSSSLQKIASIQKLR